MVWPKLTVSDYREMLRKLSASSFIVTALCVSLLRSQIVAVDMLFQSLHVVPPIKALDSISIPFGTFIVAVIMAVVSEGVKLHDNVSDVLGIRAAFDVRWILIPMALLANATVDEARLNRIEIDRKRLMAEVFYKYRARNRRRLTAI
jgi:hypothetical protein